MAHGPSMKLLRLRKGEIVDVSTIEKGSLLLKRRWIKQGPMTIEMNVAPNKLTGSTNDERAVETN